MSKYFNFKSSVLCFFRTRMRFAYHSTKQEIKEMVLQSKKRKTQKTQPRTPPSRVQELLPYLELWSSCQTPNRTLISNCQDYFRHARSNTIENTSIYVSENFPTDQDNQMVEPLLILMQPFYYFWPPTQKLIVWHCLTLILV